MTKILAITPSFSAWRGAADRLLTLETALAFSKRTALLGPVHVQPADELEVEKVRRRAEELFRIAEAETNALRGQPKATAGHT